VFRVVSLVKTYNVVQTVDSMDELVDYEQSLFLLRDSRPKTHASEIACAGLTYAGKRLMTRVSRLHAAGKFLRSLACFSARLP